MFAWPTVCGDRPAVMGIVNVTPDSFSDGGRFLDAESAIAHGASLVGQGADLLDVGGESTRPGAAPVDADEELRRVLPVVHGLAGGGAGGPADGGVPLSIDTGKASVAAAALAAGAAIVNDVTAGRADPDMFAVVADAGAGIVLMHMQGDPRTMQDDPRYDDVVDDVSAFLVERLEAARAAGLPDDALCADPGIGFGKLAHHNLALLARLPELVARVGVPVLVGTSRKAFLGAVLATATGHDVPPPAARDDATLASAVWALDHGASIVRVHDVRPVVDAARLLRAMQVIDAEAVA
jgi:dihydropteroate synthase